jgi:hypothetical protein
MTKLSDAYLAGFIDGEGSLILDRKVATEGGVQRVWFTPRLTIGNTHLGVLSAIKETIGGGFIQSHGKRVNPRHKPAWQYNLCGRRQMEPLLKRLAPLLLVKRAQADELLAFMTLMTGGGHKLSQEELSRRESVVVQMQTLNRRGA